jgi:parallel beta-helix repeat protein
MKANVSAKVRMASFGLMLLAAFCITLLSASAAKANSTITGPCPVVITEPGEYSLGAGGLSCAPNVDGIDIEASNVTLRLKGKTIEGTCGTGIGIHVLGTSAVPLTAVVVLGSGTISNFSFNFVADYSANSLVSAVKVASQCPENWGFLEDSTSSNWAFVKDVVQAPESSYGLGVYGPNNVVALCNIGDTITVGAYNNVIVDNTASNNSGGITVFGSNNQIYANTTNNNTYGDGILLTVGALGNILSENKASGNLTWDMEDDNPTCGTNIWAGDTFNAANQSCIQ